MSSLLSGVGASAFYSTAARSSLKTSSLLSASSSTTMASASSTSSSSSSSDTASEFIKYVHMNPIQRIRYDYLKTHGLTEKSLAAMPASERNAIEDEIKKQIEKKLGVKLGNISTDAVASVDITV